MIFAILASLLAQCPPTGEIRLSIVESCPSQVRITITGCAPAGSTVAQGTVQLPPTLTFAAATWVPPFGVSGYGVEDAGNRFSFQWLAAINGEVAIGELTCLPLGVETGPVQWQPLPPAIISAGYQAFPSCVEYCCEVVNAPSVPVVPCIPSPADFVAALLAGDAAADMDGDGVADGRDVQGFVAALLGP